MQSYPTFTVEQVNAVVKNVALAGMGVAVARQVLTRGEPVDDVAREMHYSIYSARQAVKALAGKLDKIRAAYQTYAEDKLTEDQFYSCVTIQRAGASTDAAYEVLVLGNELESACWRNEADPWFVKRAIDRILAKHRKFISAYGTEKVQ